MANFRIPKRKANYMMFLLPAIAVLIIALLYPIFNGLRLSFFEWPLSNINKEPVFVGLRNFQDLFSNPYFVTSIQVTLMFTISVVIIELIIGTSLALLLEGGIRGLRFFRTIYILPIMIAPVVVGVVWRFMYHPAYGKLNWFLTQFGFDPIGWLSDPDIALFSVIIADVWQWTPFVFLIVLAGLQGVPKDIIEQSKIDGADYMQTLIHIKLPHIYPIIQLAAVLRIIDSFRTLVVIFNMTFGGPGASTEVLSLHLYKTAFISQRLGMSSAVAVILLMLITAFAVILIVREIKGRKEG